MQQELKAQHTPEFKACRKPAWCSKFWKLEFNMGIWNLIDELLGQESALFLFYAVQQFLYIYRCILLCQ